MKKNILNAIVVIFVVLNMVACDSSADGDQSRSGSYNNQVSRIKAYDEFLERAGHEVPTAPEKSTADLQRVYNELRDNFTYMSDKEQYNVEDYWTIMSDDNLVGDAEDFVLTLRKKLMDDGFRLANARIARCYVPREDNKYDSKYVSINHTVLLVEVEMGRVYVVDSDAHYDFYNFPVVEWADMLDETGDYWVKLDIPGNSDRMM